MIYLCTRWVALRIQFLKSTSRQPRHIFSRKTLNDIQQASFMQTLLWGGRNEVLKWGLSGGGGVDLLIYCKDDAVDGRNPAPLWDVYNPVNNGRHFLSTGAGFLPSTVWCKWWWSLSIWSDLLRLDHIIATMTKQRSCDPSGNIVDTNRGENKKYLKPPPSAVCGWVVGCEKGWDEVKKVQSSNTIFCEKSTRHIRGWNR